MNIQKKKSKIEGMPHNMWHSLSNIYLMYMVIKMSRKQNDNNVKVKHIFDNVGTLLGIYKVLQHTTNRFFFQF